MAGLFTRRRVLGALLAAVPLLAACSGDNERPERQAQPPSKTVPTPADAPEIVDAGPVHVHGLGINPRDGALFIATHTGLFRQPEAAAKARRVADRFQDTMAFTVVGSDRFLASGHPDGRERLPPFLGLIASTDAGRSWIPVSLQGKTDFHVLEASGRRLYGFGFDWETRKEQFLVSDDAGRSWRERTAPEPLIDLAIDPDDADRAVAAGQAGLHITMDAGRRWRNLQGRPGLLAWTSAGLYSVDSTGVVRLTRHDLSGATTAGRVGGEAQPSMHPARGSCMSRSTTARSSVRSTGGAPGTSACPPGPQTAIVVIAHQMTHANPRRNGPGPFRKHSGSAAKRYKTCVVDQRK